MEFLTSTLASNLPAGLTASSSTGPLHLILAALSASHVLVLLLVVLIVRRLQRRYWNGFNQFPGPFIASVTNLWRLWDAYYNAHAPLTVMDLHETYGEVVRLGPKMLSFSSPDAVKDIYGPGKNFVKVGRCLSEMTSNRSALVDPLRLSQSTILHLRSSIGASGETISSRRAISIGILSTAEQ